MGAEISSCCGKDSTTDGAEVTVSPKKVQTATLQNGEKSAFVTRLEEGLTVNLILQDRRSLESTVKMDSYTKALIINCEVNGHKKVRSILASDVKQILQTKQQLRRVESRANIDDIELWVPGKIFIQVCGSSPAEERQLHPTVFPQRGGQAEFRGRSAGVVGDVRSYLSFVDFIFRRWRREGKHIVQHSSVSRHSVTM